MAVANQTLMILKIDHPVVMDLSRQLDVLEKLHHLLNSLLLDVLHVLQLQLCFRGADSRCERSAANS